MSLIFWLALPLAFAQSSPGEEALARGAARAAAVAEAAKWLGTPYRWGGRGTQGHPGLDCLGLLFRAWGPVTRTGWTRYPFNPSPLVASGMLGTPVVGWAGRRRADVETEALAAGDVLYLLAAEHEIPDSPLWEEVRPCGSGEQPNGVGDCTTRYWPWHTVLYVGEGWVIQAEPGGVVVVDRLEDLTFDALYVTRR